MGLYLKLFFSYFRKLFWLTASAKIFVLMDRKYDDKVKQMSIYSLHIIKFSSVTTRGKKFVTNIKELSNYKAWDRRHLLKFLTYQTLCERDNVEDLKNENFEDLIGGGSTKFISK